MNNKKGSIEMLKEIAGGVCAAKGFQAAGVHCGVKAGSSPDKKVGFSCPREGRFFRPSLAF